MAIAFQDDHHLLRRLVDGDSLVLTELFDRHGDAAFSLAMRVCGDRGRAEDAVQEAFLAIWRSADRYDAGRGSVRTWLLMITRHRCIDLLRREAARHGRDVVEDRAGDLIDPVCITEIAERSADRDALAQALRFLPDDQGQAIRLAYLHGLTRTEISSVLQLPSGTVKSRIRLGMVKLRDVLPAPA